MGQIATTEDRAAIGKRLGQVREMLQMGQSDFARVAKIHWRDYQAIEEGRGLLSANALFAICNRAAVNPAWIMTGTGYAAKFDVPAIAISIATEVFEQSGSLKNGISPETFRTVLEGALNQGMSNGVVCASDIALLINAKQSRSALS